MRRLKFKKKEGNKKGRNPLFFVFILVRDLIKNILREQTKDKKVVCDKCGWSWDLKDGGDDPYTCHKCGHTNKLQQSNFDKILEKFKDNFPEKYQNKMSLINKFVQNYVNKNKFKVKFLNACTSFSGVRTKDQIIICSPNQMNTLGDFLYTLFHEIRHEQQISQINMPNPLTDFDLENFEKIYEQYWEMELDADQFAKNMVGKLIHSLEIPIEVARENFKLSEYIKTYPQSSYRIRGMLQNVISVIEEMKSKGMEYSDIQDHPMVKPYLSKLENLF